MDVSRQVLERIDRPQRQLIEADIDKPPPEQAQQRYDGLLALDVIEHLDDDRRAVSNLAALQAGWDGGSQRACFA